MTVDLSNDDRGKTLVSRNKRLGVVRDIEGDRVYLDLDFDNVPDELAAKFDWDPDASPNTLEASAIGATRNDEVVIRDDLWPR